MITLSTNLKSAAATTQFTNYDFNSFCNFNGKSIAAKDTGLYELGGDTDNGQPISAYFEPVHSNWGTLHPKRCRYFYLSYQASGPIQLTVLPSFDNTITPRVPNAQERIRVTIPKNIVQTYWRYQVSNIDGSDFSIDSIEALFIRRSHGFSYSS